MKATALSVAPECTLVDLLDEELADGLEGVPRHLWERALGSPAREFLRRPGKQFRARLVETSWILAGGRPGTMPAALANVVELLHAGSLIVDDIEDGSEWRRSGPALHRVVGMPTALNTGNWLYFWPLELIDRLPIDEQRRIGLLREARTAVERCHRGQALDLALNVTPLEQSEIPGVVRATTRLKTGALMELASVLGAIAAGASPARIDALRQFARQLGTGLQMLDDLGSLTAESRRHKGFEDLVHARPTWPWAWLAAGSGATEFAEYQRRAAEVATGDAAPDQLADDLRDAVAEPGLERIHWSLRLGLADLEDEIGSHPALDTLRDEIARLEKSYV
jgi:geranylgeranyl pyrophosphate synthase